MFPIRPGEQQDFAIKESRIDLAFDALFFVFGRQSLECEGLAEFIAKGKKRRDTHQLLIVEDLEGFNDLYPELRV